MYGKNDFSKIINLEQINSEISPQALKHLQTNCNKPFITFLLLKKYNAVQALYNNNPVIAFPMHPGDPSFEDHKTWHCIPYKSYPKEPRFLTAFSEQRAKRKGRPAKNEKKLGLLGREVFDVNSEIVFLTEGIWDMLCLNDLSYPAVGLPGVNNFDESWLPFFKDKIIYIIFDNDEVGQKYTLIHAKKIHTVAKEVKIIKIPEIIDEQKIKDVCDIVMLFNKTKEKKPFDNLNKIKKIFEKLIDEESVLYTTTKEEIISEIIRSRGSKDIKIDMIINIILEDIQAANGSILAYNNEQELAITPDGKEILVDEDISIYLRKKYKYYDCDIWRSIRDKMHTFSIRDKKSNLYFDSVFIDDKFYIGTKNQGLLVITSKKIEKKLQGENDIYIKIHGETLKGDFEIIDIDEKITLEKILESFKYVKNPKLNQLLIKVWFYNTFLDPKIKPLLVLTGIAGSGKTLLMKMMKGILFGFNNYLPDTIPEEDHAFDLMLKRNKRLFFDEVKGFKNSSIMNKLRLIVTGVEMSFRPKYSKDLIMIKPDVHIVLATDNPQLLRDHDIAQRACIIELDKPDIIKQNETAILKKINDNRNEIWISIIKTLQNTLSNLGKYKNDDISLGVYCRQYDLANFAWKAFPNQRKDILELFNSMTIDQETFSAEQDPIVDLIEDIILEYGNNGDYANLTAKQLHNLTYPKAKEKGIKIPLSTKGFVRWLIHRESVLKDRFGMTKEKDLHLNVWTYKFKINKEDGGGF